MLGQVFLEILQGLRVMSFSFETSFSLACFGASSTYCVVYGCVKRHLQRSHPLLAFTLSECGALSEPKKNFGLPVTVARRSASRSAGVFATGLPKQNEPSAQPSTMKGKWCAVCFCHCWSTFLDNFSGNCTSHMFKHYSKTRKSLAQLKQDRKKALLCSQDRNITLPRTFLKEIQDQTLALHLYEYRIELNTA